MERKRLIQFPELEKVEIATYLVNTLSLKQLLIIEDLARSGKLKKITGGTVPNKDQNQSDESSEITKPGKTVAGRRLRYMVID